MLKKLYFWFGPAFILFFSSSVFAITINDNGKINATNVSHIIDIKSEADIQRAIQLANQKNISIAIMGKQHSQGGQSLASNAIELNMLPFNKVLQLNREKKQVTVQSGITWADLQKFINPANLAVKSMQSPNIFTVGGSISVNAHGDDFRVGAVENSVVAFHLLLANGEKIFVTPTQNKALWAAVIGGYGLFGVITDVTLQLTDNNLLQGQYKEINFDNFITYFHQQILNQNKIVLFYAHLNITPDENFLRDMYVVTYTDSGKLPPERVHLEDPDRWNMILTPLFNVSRHGIKGKKWRWNMEKHIFSHVYANRIVTRNNAMEKPVTFASNYHNKKNTDWLQEYFIPIDQLPVFIKDLRKSVLKNNVNLLNVTIRYVPREENILLNYAKNNCFAVVLYFNQNLSSDALNQAREWTQKLIATALAVNGNYYLPYQNFATVEQFKQAYPEYKKVIELKKIYDPKKLFSNKFYQTYFQ